MPEQDFELYLSLLGKLLKLRPEQSDSIRDELRDHLEQRLEELAATGLDRPRAIRQALDEFGDAALLAEEFSRLARERRRRRIVRWTLAGSVAAAVAILVTFAFWPVAPHGPTHMTAVADDKSAPVVEASPPKLFLDVEPTCVDPIQFMPTELQVRTGGDGADAAARRPARTAAGT